jgi:dihydrofolate reductase
VVLTRQNTEIADVVICHSPEEAAEFCKSAERAMVIGGGSVYRQMLPMCDKAYITKVHVTPESDTYFPNLDQDPGWRMAEVLQSGEENGVAFEMCLYERK